MICFMPECNLACLMSCPLLKAELKIRAAVSEDKIGNIVDRTRLFKTYFGGKQYLCFRSDVDFRRAHQKNPKLSQVYQIRSRMM